MNANNDNNKKQVNFGGSHYGFFFVSFLFETPKQKIKIGK